jgi:hypothetical protein
LRERAAAVLAANRRDGYTVPAAGLYPYQWCWDSGPIALGWAATGDWDQAWRELTKLMAAQWPSGMVPHIVFWRRSRGYFPGPRVWHAGPRRPSTTGITQPPLPVTAAARLFETDPDRARAQRHLRRLWPRLVGWLEWIARARRGPHGAFCIVHPWESGMDNAPSYDVALHRVPDPRRLRLHRRDLAVVNAAQRPTDEDYRDYLGIVEALRADGWDTERQTHASPFVIEDVGFTAITVRAASDLAAAAPDLGLDPAPLARIAGEGRAGIGACWRDDRQWFAPFDVRAHAVVATPCTVAGLLALWARAASADQAGALADHVERWRRGLTAGVPTCDPGAPEFDPVRYWRGSVWVIVNWMVADGLSHYGEHERARELKALTRSLVEREGFAEYYDPRTGAGIGGQGFSWSAALTLWWLTA